MRSTLGWAALGLACAIVALPGRADAKPLSGVVFDDRNGDGRRQSGEPGVPGVALSDGRALVVTDAAGRYRIDPAPGSTVFAIKPADWRLPGDDPARPGAWRHVPSNAPIAPKYGGIRAASWSPAFDIGLRRAPAAAGPLSVRVFADPQPKSRVDVDYYGRDIVDSVLAEPAAAPDARLPPPQLGASLGDIVNDDLSLYPAMNAQTRRIGVPWLHVPGNHDLDLDVARDEDALLGFRNVYGPDTFAWEEPQATFIGLDDVIYRPGQSPAYIGGFRDDQFAFLEAYLPRVSKDRLLVLMMHIPLFETDGRDTFRDADRARLFALSLAFIMIFANWGLTSAAYYIGAGCVLVLFVRHVLVPTQVKVIVAEIAGASMFLYLTHFQVISLVHKLFGRDIPWLSLGLSIIVGVTGAHVYAWLDRKVRQSRLMTRTWRRGASAG